MKLSIAVARDDAPPSASVALRGFETSIERAAGFGYDGIELALGSAGEVDRERLERVLARYDREVSCISTGLVFAESRLSLTDDATSGTARQVLSEMIGLAADFGGKVALGRACGSIPAGMTRDQALDRFRESVLPLCERAEKTGVMILLEPLNRFAGNLINTVGQAAELIERIGSPSLGIMPDCFHMNIEERRIGQAFSDGGGRVGHVHLADSNRLAPGQGHIDFEDVLDGLGAIGYDGWLSVEILPEPTPDIAAEQAAEYLIPMIRSRNT